MAKLTWGRLTLALLLACGTPVLAQDSKPPAPADQKTDAPKPDDSSAAQKPKHSTAEDNPFPEDISRKAAEPPAPDAPDAPAAKGTDAPAANPPDGSSSRDNAPPSDPADARGIKLSPPKPKRQAYDPKLAADDIRIADFYMKTGDYAGAYGRYKEAAAANPGNGEAIFGLAESARKTNHADEAKENYQVYLSALPDGPKAKAARKALSELERKK